MVIILVDLCFKALMKHRYSIITVSFIKMLGILSSLFAQINIVVRLIIKAVKKVNKMLGCIKSGIENNSENIVMLL